VLGFNALSDIGGVRRPALLIVARGGGSVEDLMPFNEECVVRAVAESKIPVISAVGHETDTTLIDYVSDLRAPTPTAAAEKAVPVREEILAQVVDDGARLFQAFVRMSQEKRERLRLIERALGDPSRVLEPLAQRLDERAERLLLAWRSFFERRRARINEASGRLRHPRDIVRIGAQRLANADQRLGFAWQNLLTRLVNRLGNSGMALQHLSPLSVLGRGYALVQDAEGHVVSSADRLKPKDTVTIQFKDGSAKAEITPAGAS